MGLLQWILNLHNSEFLAQMISNGGIPVVSAIIFAETGLLLGFFLPGDSLLITAGVLTSSSAIGGRPLLSLIPLLIFAAIAGVVGDQVGFILGQKSRGLSQPQKNPKLKKYLDEATEFFTSYGNKAIIYARFMPIVRTFVPFAAGISNMSYTKFAKLNVIGALVWVVSMVLIGHYLGKTPLADHLHKIVLVVVVVSFIPVVIGIIRRARRKRLG